VARALEDDAQVMSNTQLDEQLVGEPADVKAEILRINTEARPLALQIGMLVPVLSAFGGLVVSFRMKRRPQAQRTGAVEGLDLG
jgi:hypothetical protein